MTSRRPCPIAFPVRLAEKRLGKPESSTRRYNSPRVSDTVTLSLSQLFSLPLLSLTPSPLEGTFTEINIGGVRGIRLLSSSLLNRS